MTIPLGLSIPDGLHIGWNTHCRMKCRLQNEMPTAGWALAGAFQSPLNIVVERNTHINKQLQPNKLLYCALNRLRSAFSIH